MLNKILSTKKGFFFQFRLKNYTFKKKFLIGKKIKKICKKNNVKFLINDDPMLTKKLDADGCHLGQKDTDIIEALEKAERRIKREKKEKEKQKQANTTSV